MSQPPAGSSTFVPYTPKFGYQNKSTQYGKPFYAKIIEQKNADAQAKYDTWKALPDGDAKYQQGVDLGYIDKVDYDNYVVQKTAIDTWNALPNNDEKYKKGVELGYLDKADYNTYIQQKSTIDRWNAMPEGIDKAKEGLKLGYISVTDYNNYTNAIESGKARLNDFTNWSGQPMTESSINDGYNKGFYGADVRDQYIQDLKAFDTWKNSPDTYQKMQDGIEKKYMTVAEGGEWYNTVLHNQEVTKYNSYNPDIERLKALVDKLDPKDQLLTSQDLREELRLAQEAQLNYGINVGLTTEAEYKAGRAVIDRNNSIEIYNSMFENTSAQQLQKLEYRKENLGFDKNWTESDYLASKSIIDVNKKISTYNSMPETTYTEKLDKIQYRKDNMGFTEDWTPEVYKAQLKAAEQEVFVNKLLRDGVIETESTSGNATKYIIKKTELTDADISLLKDAGFKVYGKDFIGPTGNIIVPKVSLDQGAMSVKLGNLADQFGNTIVGPFGIRLDPQSLFNTWAVAVGEVENIVNPILKGISPLVTLIPGTVPFDYGENYDLENMPTSLTGYKRGTAEFLGQATGLATDLVLWEMGGAVAGKLISGAGKLMTLPAKQLNLQRSIMGNVLERASKLFSLESAATRLNLEKSAIGSTLEFIAQSGKVAGKRLTDITIINGSVMLTKRAIITLAKIPITRDMAIDVATHAIPTYFETEKVLALQEANVPMNEIMKIVATDLVIMFAFDEGFARGTGTRSMLDIDIERMSNLSKKISTYTNKLLKVEKEYLINIPEKLSTRDFEAVKNYVDDHATLYYDNLIKNPPLDVDVDYLLKQKLTDPSDFVINTDVLKPEFDLLENPKWKHFADIEDALNLNIDTDLVKSIEKKIIKTELNVVDSIQDIPMPDNEGMLNFKTDIIENIKIPDVSVEDKFVVDSFKDIPLQDNEGMLNFATDIIDNVKLPDTKLIDTLKEVDSILDVPMFDNEGMFNFKTDIVENIKTFEPPKPSDINVVDSIQDIPIFDNAGVVIDTPFVAIPTDVLEKLAFAPDDLFVKGDFTISPDDLNIYLPKSSEAILSTAVVDKPLELSNTINLHYNESALNLDVDIDITKTIKDMETNLLKTPKVVHVSDIDDAFNLSLDTKTIKTFEIDNNLLKNPVVKNFSDIDDAFDFRIDSKLIEDVKIPNKEISEIPIDEIDITKNIKLDNVIDNKFFKVDVDNIKLPEKPIIEIPIDEIDITKNIKLDNAIESKYFNVDIDVSKVNKIADIPLEDINITKNIKLENFKESEFFNIGVDDVTAIEIKSIDTITIPDTISPDIKDIIKKVNSGIPLTPEEDALLFDMSYKPDELDVILKDFKKTKDAKTLKDVLGPDDTSIGGTEIKTSGGQSLVMRPPEQLLKPEEILKLDELLKKEKLLNLEEILKLDDLLNAEELIKAKELVKPEEAAKLLIKKGIPEDEAIKIVSKIVNMSDLEKKIILDKLTDAQKKAVLAVSKLLSEEAKKGVVFKEDEIKNILKVILNPTSNSISKEFEKMDERTLHLILPKLDEKTIAKNMDKLDNRTLIKVFNSMKPAMISKVLPYLDSKILSKTFLKLDESLVSALTPMEISSIIYKIGFDDVEKIRDIIKKYPDKIPDKIKDRFPKLGGGDEEDDRKRTKEKPSKKALLYKVLFFYKDKTKTVEKKIYARTFSDALNKTWFERGSNVIPKRVKVIFLGKEEVKK